jgi:hypothetical protein
MSVSMTTESLYKRSFVRETEKIGAFFSLMMKAPHSRQLKSFREGFKKIAS